MRIAKNNCRLKRFAEAVINEIENVCENKDVDIRTYGQEVYEKYGVGYKVNEDEEEKGRKALLFQFRH